MVDILASRIILNCYYTSIFDQWHTTENDVQYMSVVAIPPNQMHLMNGKKLK